MDFWYFGIIKFSGYAPFLVSCHHLAKGCGLRGGLGARISNMSPCKSPHWCLLPLSIIWSMPTRCPLAYDEACRPPGSLQLSSPPYPPLHAPPSPLLLHLLSPFAPISPALTPLFLKQPTWPLLSSTLLTHKLNFLHLTNMLSLSYQTLFFFFFTRLLTQHNPAPTPPGKLVNYCFHSYVLEQNV